MLLDHPEFLFSCFAVVTSISVLCATYAYYVDSKRLADDPKKKRYPPLAILLAPITLPLFRVLYILIFILRAVMYGVFLALFIFALIFLRKPFLLERLKKIALAIGNLLLEANTLLIRIFLRPLARSSGSA
jgi:hypothetical protein